MAERELAIIIRARDLASRTVGKVRKEIGTLGRTGTRAMNGLSVAMTRLAAGAAVALVGALALGARTLGHLERVANQTIAVLKSTRHASGQTAESIRKQAEALEQLTTADDKNIQEAQNLLLTFTKIGGKTFPKATEAAINMAIAMAKGDVAAADFKGTAIQVGKALNDPLKGITALSKAGVSFTEQQKDQIKALVKAGKTEQAQAVILKELATEFGNAGKAAGTGFEADLRRVQDAGEDATTALARGIMPALGRFARFLQTKLADKKVIATLDAIGEGLGKAADQAIDFIEHMDFAAIGRGLSEAKDAAKTIVSTFMGLPDWVKAAVIGGWGLNKLTGGAVTSLLGGVIKGVLGMTAGVVNIKAGVVNGAGGGAGGSAPTSKAGRITSAVGKVFIVGAAVAAFAELIGVLHDQTADNVAAIKDLKTNTAAFGSGSSAAEIQASLTGIEKYSHDLLTGLTPEAIAYQLNIDGVLDAVNATKAALRLDLAHAIAAENAGTTAVEKMKGNIGGLLSSHHRDSVNKQNNAIERLRGGLGKDLGNVRSATTSAGHQARSGGMAAAAAIRAKRLSVKVSTNVSVSTSVSIRDLGKTVVRNNRYGNTREIL